MPRSQAAIFAWLLAYAATLAVVIGALVWSRQWAMRELGSPEARRHWQQWRNEEIRRAERKQGPVRRRPPIAEEPPLLILLRDSFSGIVVGVVVIVSVLFGFVMYVARALFRSTPSARSTVPGQTDTSGKLL